MGFWILITVLGQRYTTVLAPPLLKSVLIVDSLVPAPRQVTVDVGTAAVDVVVRLEDEGEDDVGDTVVRTELWGRGSQLSPQSANAELTSRNPKCSKGRPRLTGCSWWLQQE